nr:alpha/beta fold hydrolase [Candidatus Njordarchaeum guaymaensis]
MPKVKCGDINVCYEVRGKGFPVVMIMGLSGNMDSWDPRLIEGLSEKYSTVLFDNRGAGRTDAPKVDYSIKMFADDTARLMDNLKIQRAHVFGISMGGAIAQELTLSYPQKVEKLVLCSSNCGISKSVPASPKVMSVMMSCMSPAAKPEDMVSKMVSLAFTEEFIKSNSDIIKQRIERALTVPIAPDAFRRQLMAASVWDSYARLPMIKAPTLVMAGKKDILVPPENARILADRIPGAKLIYFEESGHLLPSHEPDRVLSTLLQFFA